MSAWVPSAGAVLGSRYPWQPQGSLSNGLAGPLGHLPLLTELFDSSENRGRETMVGVMAGRRCLASRKIRRTLMLAEATERAHPIQSAQ